MKKETETPLLTDNGIIHPEAAQVQDALASLEKYMTLMQNNNRLFESGIQIELTGEYNDVSMKRTTLIESIAQNADFINTALTGSYFSEVSFKKCRFDESNLQFCQFIHNKFNDTEIHSTNLSYSNFYNTAFEHVTFKGSTVSEILFERCSFSHCSFTSSMLENTVFTHCVFEHVEFVNTNIEYMEIKNCKLGDVCLPMAQAPYVFGLIQDMWKNKRNIVFSADNELLTVDEYWKLKDSLMIYYSSILEYFPLANLYLESEDKEPAYECISLGMERAIIQRNFRMLKFFCKQAKIGNAFPYSKLKELHMKIEKFVAAQTLNIYEQRSFIYNIGEIRSILLNSIDDCPTARIVMQTNIDSSEAKKILQFLEYVDLTIEGLCSQKVSHIEYSHNSLANFIAFISANYAEVLFTVSTFLLLSNNIIDSVQKKILSQQQIKLNKLEIKERENKLKMAADKNKELKNSGIHYTIQYIIDNPVIDQQDVNIYL